MGRLVLVHRDSYHDSVRLMRLSETLRALDSVADAAVVMGTPANRALLTEQGYGGPDLEGAGPNDLVVAVLGDVERTAVEAEVERLLRVVPSGDPETGVTRPASLREALDGHPEAGLVLVSVPGEHAAREARLALRRGRHVMPFSDNVSVADEVALKREALARGLLLMGPDCGTAIIDGLPLGFANAVRRGPIGIVGAAGTGIQEVASCIHRLGGGISQAIGTGGRDLSDAVGGAMTLAGIAALAADPGTRVIVVVSKPPSAVVARRVVAALAETGMPAVIQFVGDNGEHYGVGGGVAGRDTERLDRGRLGREGGSGVLPGAGGSVPRGGVRFASSLAGAAEEACRLAGIVAPPIAAPVDPARAEALARHLPPDARLCGLFCGGTTGQEALALLGRIAPDVPVRSNLHHAGPLWIDGLGPVDGHLLLDLGDDVFTRGRPHPMIEPGLRNERLAVEVERGRVGLLLFDCVLGYGAHPDPAGVLAGGVREAATTAAAAGRELVAIASVTGTPEDPQDSRRQVAELEAAGMVVEASNAAAAALAAEVLRRVAG